VSRLRCFFDDNTRELLETGSPGCCGSGVAVKLLRRLSRLSAGLISRHRTGPAPQPLIFKIAKQNGRMKYTLTCKEYFDKSCFMMKRCSDK
jgi:hypothetical protein